MRTNCNNCGGVLVEGKCPYCKAVWFKPGFQIGNNAYVAHCAINYRHTSIDVTTWGDTRPRYISGPPVIDVELHIVGLTEAEVMDLYAAIYKTTERGLHEKRDSNPQKTYARTDEGSSGRG